MEEILKVENISKKYQTKEGEVLFSITELPPGEELPEGKRRMRVAVAGCVHGEIQKVRGAYGSGKGETG